MRIRPVIIWYIAGAWMTLSATHERIMADVVGVLVQVRHQVRHIHSRLAVPAPLAMRGQAERVVFEELAVDLAEAGRERLAVELLQQRLGIEQVHLAGTARHEQEDATLRLRREMPRARGQAGWRGCAPAAVASACKIDDKASSPKPFPVRFSHSRRFNGLIGGTPEQGPGQCLEDDFITIAFPRVLRSARLVRRVRRTIRRARCETGQDFIQDDRFRAGVNPDLGLVVVMDRAELHPNRRTRPASSARPLRRP